MISPGTAAIRITALDILLSLRMENNFKFNFPTKVILHWTNDWAFCPTNLGFKQVGVWLVAALLQESV
jgi:hypothetical protein